MAKKKPVPLSAGAVLVRRDGSEWRYLLLRLYSLWEFPKGMVESGEDPLAAAIREVEEETTLTALKFRWGEDFRETVPYARGKVARFYLAEAPRWQVSLPVNPELGRPEHHEHRWLGFEQARRLLPERLAPILDWAHATVERG